MDLIPEERKEVLFEKRKAQLKEKAGKFKVTAFPTSIWEISLYKAWTEIVSSLISSMPKLKASLANFATACGAQEINLFERSTFILTCNYATKQCTDEQRFEKISHIIKKFKLSCMSAHAQFKSMVIQTKNFTAYLDEFTKATYIMIIINDKKVNLELLRMNVALAKDEFENIINDDSINNPNA